MNTFTINTKLPFGTYKGKPVRLLIRLKLLQPTLLYYYYLNEEVDFDHILQKVLGMAESDLIPKPGRIGKKATIERVSTILQRKKHVSSSETFMLRKTSKELVVRKGLNKLGAMYAKGKNMTRNRTKI